jgi:MSHA biogenesis protein MshO
MRRISSERGFTLVEMIVSITLIGILAMVMVPMLQLPMASYQDAARRADTTADLDLAVGKLRADLAQALPGSLRSRQVGNRWMLEFLTVRAQGRYRNGTTATATARCSAACSGTAKSNDQLEFGACAESCFTSLGPLEPATYAPVSGNGDAVMVNAIENDPYAIGAMSLLTGFASSAPNSLDGARLQMPAKVMQAVKPSPTQRFYIVASTPVSYVCDPGTGRLTRVWGYARQAVQPTSFAAAVPSAPLALTVRGCAFRLASTVPRYVAGEPRRQVLNAWLSVARPAANGLGSSETAEALVEISVREE